MNLLNILKFNSDAIKNQYRKDIGKIQASPNERAAYMDYIDREDLFDNAQNIVNVKFTQENSTNQVQKYLNDLFEEVASELNFNSEF